MQGIPPDIQRFLKKLDRFHEFACYNYFTCGQAIQNLKFQSSFQPHVSLLCRQYFLTWLIWRIFADRGPVHDEYHYTESYAGREPR